MPEIVTHLFKSFTYGLVSREAWHCRSKNAVAQGLYILFSTLTRKLVRLTKEMTMDTMKKYITTIKGETVNITVHFIDGDVAEVYATWDGMEIAFAYDLESMSEQLDLFFISVEA